VSHPRHPRHPHPAQRAHPAQPPDAFRDLKASELFCPRCQASRPVRERLLLVLPDGELHEYRCAACAHSLGTRTVSGRPPGRIA
jgi:rubredoxin